VCAFTPEPTWQPIGHEVGAHGVHNCADVTFRDAVVLRRVVHRELANNALGLEVLVEDLLLFAAELATGAKSRLFTSF
jgi:hypothetical protein